MSKGQLKIKARSNQPFASRRQAAMLLSQELIQFKEQNVVVLGIPRGGVVIASTIAMLLKGELDIALAQKLGAPRQEELAMGAIDESGEAHLNEWVVSQLNIDLDYIEAEKNRQRVELERKRSLYRQRHAKIPLEGRVVILTDDGIATGATFQAALWAVRAEQPAQLIVAIPVGPEDSLEKLSQECDALIALNAPPYFESVGQYYDDFSQVGDDVVLGHLDRHHPQS